MRMPAWVKSTHEILQNYLSVKYSVSIKLNSHDLPVIFNIYIYNMRTC